jgi:hypothetical protein
MQVLSTIRAYLPHFLAKGSVHAERGIRAELADLAPVGPIVTAYDEQNIDTYLRVLSAAQEGTNWRDVSRTVLRVDPDQDAERARRMFESHLARAKWMTHQLLRIDWPD